MPLIGPPSTLGNVPGERRPDHELLGRRRHRRTVGHREARVVEDQQVVVLRIADDLFLGGNRTESGERDLDVGLAGFGTRLVAGGRRQQRLRADALGEQVGAELQRGEWRDDGEGPVDGRQLRRDPFELGEVRPLVQLADVGTVGGGEQQDDGLTAEVVLERHVVDGDLRVGVEVAVLTGGELDVAPSDAEHHGDQHDDGDDQLPVLAERNSEPPPESFHPHVHSPSETS